MVGILKMGKRIIVITLCAITILVICGCSNHTSEDIKEYGGWNAKTQEIIESRFHNTLPSDKIVDLYGCKYYYSFTQGMFGDPNIIIITLQFDTNKEYWDAKYTYENILKNGVLEDSLTDKISGYLDDTIHDGMFYDFELFIADDNNQQIQIVNAYVWDYYRNDRLVSLLEHKSGDDSLIS